MIISGCAGPQIPDILHIGECERGIVTETNLQYVQELWPQAQVTDVLISGGCYQNEFIKERTYEPKQAGG